MSCKPEIVFKKQITNDTVGYLVVCCGEQCCIRQGCRDNDHDCCSPEAHTCEESWHTVSIHLEDHDSYMTEKLAEVATRHGKMLAWREKHGK